MKVIIRADASLQIGTGHVMRCLTLAQALRDRDFDCRFICRAHEGHLLERIQQAGFEVLVLPLVRPSSISPSSELPPLAHGDWLGTTWQTDAEQTITALTGWQPDWLVVDHYALDAQWELALRPYCAKIMAIDDLADRQHACDLLLDQNLVANLEHRYDGLLPSRCTRLLGPNYALLQSQYGKFHSSTPPRLGPIQRILIFFGGADNYNLTGRAVAAFLAMERADIALDVVINPASVYAETIREQVKDYANITVHGILPSLAPLMLDAELAIGAGGVTSWERCCLGLPSLVITVADNQKHIAAELDRRRLAHWLGDQETVSKLKLKEALQEALVDNGLLSWSRRCLVSVDGQGAERVAAIIGLNETTQLKPRLANLADEALLLQWANDPLVRQNAFNSKSIDAETHRRWFYQRLRNPAGCQIYIMETEAGLPIGQVRFELSDDGWVISYALDAIARGRKLGAKLLQTAIYAFRQSRKGSLALGRVKLDNLPSRKIFENLGFSITSRGDSWLVYHYLL